MIGLGILFIMTTLRSGVTGFRFATLMIVFLLFMILPLILIRFWAIRNKYITNWDVSNRIQRVRALLVLAVLLVFDYVILQFFSTPYMQQFFLFLLVSFFGFFLITLKFKISGHMWTATLLICMFVYWYGWIMVPLFLMIPLIAWSRLMLKRHTVGEVIGGVVYSIMVFFLAGWLHLI